MDDLFTGPKCKKLSKTLNNTYFYWAIRQEKNTLNGQESDALNMCAKNNVKILRCFIEIELKSDTPCKQKVR